VTLAATAFTLVEPRAARGATPEVTLIDDFEGANAERAWKFSNGSEFPGATGLVALAAGAQGQGVKLGYDFSLGGLYVAATREFSPGIDVSLLRMKVLLPAAAKLGLRVQDATGQWLQFDVARPLAPIDPAAWFTTTVDLTSADSHWSGTDDGVLHRPITAVSLLAQASAAHPTDAVLVDDIEGLSALELALDPSALPLVPVPHGAESLFDGIGVAVHDLDDRTGLDEAMNAGFKWARTDLFWEWVETTPGRYDFGGFDDFFDALDARGMKPIFILDFGNQLYCEGPPTTVDAQTAFSAYALAAAKHFAGRGARFEIWNEPNAASFWPPAPDAQAFATLSQRAAQAVHEGDPAARVITGGLSWFDFDYLASSLGQGAGAQADAVGIHPYRGIDAPETLAAHVVRANLTIADNAGTSAPLSLWDTEWGYASSQFGAGNSAFARQRQAIFAARRLLAARVVGFPLAVWYDLQDDGTTPELDEENFGLLTKGGSQKPAYLAVKTLHEAARDRSVLGVVDVAQPLLSGVVLAGASDRSLVLWATSPAQAVTIDVPSPAVALDVIGNPLPLQTSYTLLEALGPIYLTYPKQAVVDDGGGSGASDEDGGHGGVASSHGGEGGSGGDGSLAARGGSSSAPLAAGGPGTTPMSAGGAAGRNGAAGTTAAPTAMAELQTGALHGTCGCRAGATSSSAQFSPYGIVALLSLARGLSRSKRREAASAASTPTL
jgi:hypothetical protein